MRQDRSGMELSKATAVIYFRGIEKCSSTQ